MMPTYHKTMYPLIFSALLLAVVLGLAGAAAANLAAKEIPLNPEGSAYEINPGQQGLLWISDNGTEEVWALDPPSGVYTVYHDAGRVSDARQASDGSVWWIDQGDDSLSRLWPDSGEATTWVIPGAATLLGTAIDGQGAVWLSQYFDPQFYRFDVEANQVCTYTLSSIGGSDYILAHGAEIWLGDWINDSIHRLDPESGQLASWELPSIPGISSYPEGLAMDGAGNLWWADVDRHHLARLEAESDRLTTYPLPYGSAPNMVAVSGRGVWYTEGWEGSLGRLDPDLASGSSTILSRETVPLTPTCATLSSDWTGTLTITTGTAPWNSASYTTTVDADGWWIHQLPVEAYPWGIAAQDGQIWFVDNGRQVLARFQESLTVTACKLADDDGDLNTTDDQTPEEGWTIHLVADGDPVEPDRLTGTDGCTTWSDLEPGVSYAVQEEVPPGWTPLTPTSHEFGVLVPGEFYSYTFINKMDEDATRSIHLPLVVR